MLRSSVTEGNFDDTNSKQYYDMGFMTPKAPPLPPKPDPKTQVETIDEPAKRRTILNQRKNATGASDTLLSPNQFGQRQTLG